MRGFIFSFFVLALNWAQAQSPYQIYRLSADHLDYDALVVYGDNDKAGRMQFGRLTPHGVELSTKSYQAFFRDNGVLVYDEDLSKPLFIIDRNVGNLVRTRDSVAIKLNELPRRINPHSPEVIGIEVPSEEPNLLPRVVVISRSGLNMGSGMTGSAGGGYSGSSPISYRYDVAIGIKDANGMVTVETTGVAYSSDRVDVKAYFTVNNVDYILKYDGTVVERTSGRATDLKVMETRYAIGTQPSFQLAKPLAGERFATFFPNEGLNGGLLRLGRETKQGLQTLATLEALSPHPLNNRIVFRSGAYPTYAFPIYEYDRSNNTLTEYKSESAKGTVVKLKALPNVLPFAQQRVSEAIKPVMPEAPGNCSIALSTQGS